MNKTSIPLMPTSEAIIYRNFIQGAGSRAIGVGFPEHANLAFDANEIRLAMIWQGALHGCPPPLDRPRRRLRAADRRQHHAPPYRR